MPPFLSPEYDPAFPADPLPMENVRKTCYRDPKTNVGSKDFVQVP